MSEEVVVNPTEEDGNPMVLGGFFVTPMAAPLEVKVTGTRAAVPAAKVCWA